MSAVVASPLSDRRREERTQPPPSLASIQGLSRCSFGVAIAFVERVIAMTSQSALPSRVTTPRVLIADDQPSISDALVFLLKIRGVHADVVSSPVDVLQSVTARQYDLLLMDMNYEQDTTSGAEGLRLVDAVREIDPALGVVVMTAWSTVEIAVAALQRGAADFIQKPWDNDHAARVI